MLVGNLCVTLGRDICRALSPTEATFLLREGNRDGKDRVRYMDLNFELAFGPHPEPMVGVSQDADWPNDQGWRPIFWPGDACGSVALKPPDEEKWPHSTEGDLHGERTA